MIKLQTPQYRFHYYLQDDNTGDNKSHEDNKNVEKVSSSSDTNSNGDLNIVNYRVDKSNGLQTNVNNKADGSPLKISLKNHVYNPETYVSTESLASSDIEPIVVEPMITQEQKSSKSMEIDSKDEYQPAETTDKAPPSTEEISTNQTEDRKDDIKDDQATDQILIQDEGITIKQTEFTVPFKKPNPVNADNFKYNDNEAIKKDIVKVIQNLNVDQGQYDPHLNFKSSLSDKPLKIVGADSIEIEQQQSHQPSQGHSNFKSQQLSNKPLRLYGYNPSVFGSLYDMHVDYNRPSQIQQPPNTLSQGHFTGYEAHKDYSRPQAYEGSGVYLTQPSSTFQTGYKENQKYNTPTAKIPQPLYYYDPNAMAMLPIYTNMIQNSYPLVENKPQPSQSQVESGKSGFNLMHILSGGSFYKGSEQAESTQQMTVKDTIKQESNKLENFKPLETHDSSKKPQTVMFYLNPNESQADLKSFTSSPIQLAFNQQEPYDCNGQNHKAPAVKSDKLLQPIPLCSDCVPALGFMGLSNTKSGAIEQKKSITAPQVMPIWNGQNVSKYKYLILPTPINKK